MRFPFSKTPYQKVVSYIPGKEDTVELIKLGAALAVLYPAVKGGVVKAWTFMVGAKNDVAARISNRRQSMADVG